MANKVTTIFISDDAINLLVVEGRRVKKWGSLPLEPGLVNQGLIKDEAKVAAELSKLALATKVKTKRVVAGISGLNSLYRMISLPELPEAIVPEAVKQEAKRVIPVPLEEVYLSYQRLSSASGETRVFLAAFPRNVADALYRTLHQAGFLPYVMDLAPLALCRTLDQARAIIVNSRLDNLDIIVMSEGLPQPIRTLSLPGEATTLSERLTAIGEEIDRTVAFYNSSHKDSPLDATVPMFVSGDLAGVPESWPALGTKSKGKVSAVPSPVESPDGFNPNDFMVNIGLALRDVPPVKEGNGHSLINFNALPEVYLPKPVHLTNILYPIGVALAIGVVVYMGFMLRNSGNETTALRAQIPPAIESRVIEQRAEVATLREQVAQGSGQAAEPLEKTAGVFDTTYVSLEVGRYRIDEEMSEMVKWLPPAVNLNRVSDSGDTIDISGRAPSESDIFIYAKNLAIRFNDVTILSVKLVVDRESGESLGYDFKLLVK